jgi:hypothetical protein
MPSAESPTTVPPVTLVFTGSAQAAAVIAKAMANAAASFM